ncbi:MAG: glycosyltransferase [Nitrososphaerota archaeon]|jgi:cellulose synthase/poly-beta-1,6-N-acetylglucosamine synthase-like glycosyltransferase|nr:glycosyltransferase [Nitrososphaerota archaeon]MDG6936514.1 glycosyltransferase [Nitrososphaerota archaeon]MDG6944989.1 glycosyltransferase [Nitrososphaerota archaeon]
MFDRLKRLNIFLAINALAFAMLFFIIKGGMPALYIPFYILVSLYTAYNVVIFIYSLKWHHDAPIVSQAGTPKVAILYMTYNDLNEQSLDSIFNLSYNNKEIWIVDDSTNQQIRDRIDALAQNRAKVVRRDNRKGFKAGAINNAMRNIGAEYISICDSDEMLPRDYIERSLMYFTNDDIAFVQASHYAYNKVNSWTELMGYGVDLHWETYQDYRNKHAVVNFLGHGALIRTSALRDVGGIPELVSEDIALTVELYNRGYKGVFARSVRVGEAFPQTYHQFKKRHKKWSMGAVEFMKKYWLKILTSRKLSVWQKEDLFLSMLSLPMNALLIIFILMASFIHIPFNYIVIVIYVATVLSPSLMFMKLDNTKKLMKSVALNAVAFMSLFPTSLFYVLKGFVSPTFLVTGQKESAKNPTFLNAMSGIAKAAVILADLIVLVILRTSFSPLTAAAFAMAVIISAVLYLKIDALMGIRNSGVSNEICASIVVGMAMMIFSGGINLMGAAIMATPLYYVLWG